MFISKLEHLVLDLLSTRDAAYGLELVGASGGRLKRGSVYVTLGRMEEKGLVRSRLEGEPGEGPARRLYEATALGKRALIVSTLAAAIPLGARR